VGIARLVEKEDEDVPPVEEPPPTVPES
jgi:hypothetical protein